MDNNTPLLSNETKIDEVRINSEIFTVTNKRILYKNALDGSNAFIGINEFVSATYSTQKMKFYRLNWSSEAWLPIWAIIAIAGTYIYVCSTDRSMKFGDMAPLLVALLYSIGVTPALLILAYVTKLMSAYSQDTVTFQIIKNDGNFWLNQYYDKSHLKSVEQITNSLNNAKYS